MATLAIVWAWIKKHWRLVLAGIGSFFAFIAGAFLFKKQQTSYADQIKAINDAHALELQQINAARAQEEVQHQADLKKLNDTLAVVQAQYDAAQKQLDDQKKAEVAALVKQYGNDPNALAQKLSESTGFKIILPQ